MSASGATPVALFIFNRPDTTARVLDAIAQAQPAQLFVVADGPRPHKRGEAELCRKTRALLEKVSWPCTVLRNYSDTNLGCRWRISSGLDWVFEQVPEAIVLEDDCLPDPSFFVFCEELLHRYRNDERVMMISGNNFHLEPWLSRESYYFSQYAHIWGWASWRRAWRQYPGAQQQWPALRDSGWLERQLDSRLEARQWRQWLDETFSGRVDTWDYQWQLACWIGRGLVLVPAQNLVLNIGFGAGSTHARAEGWSAELKLGSLQFPLNHPADVAHAMEADRMEFKLLHPAPTMGFRVRRFVARWWKRLVTRS